MFANFLVNKSVSSFLMYRIYEDQTRHYTVVTTVKSSILNA